MPLLKVEHVSKDFGGLRALSDVSFDIESGLILGLIGPNGAGKTTMINLINGLESPDGGRILFKNQPIRGGQAHRLAGLGVARTYQNARLFKGLTLLENVMVGKHVRTRTGLAQALFRPSLSAKEDEKCKQDSLAILELLGIDRQSGKLAGQLPFGQQRLAELARALATEPELLLADEPAAGLNYEETKALCLVLKKLRSLGITILLVEHNIRMVMSIVDSIVVLDAGVKIAEGQPSEIVVNEAVVRCYLGKERRPTC